MFPGMMGRMPDPDFIAKQFLGPDGARSAEDFVRKGLDSTSQSGRNLIPQLIDPAIAELAMLVSPLYSWIPRIPWSSGTYDRNVRTALGSARAVGDGTSAPETGSTYTRIQESLKIVMAKGGVTGFLQAASQTLTDAYANEVFGHTVATVYEEEFLSMYGNPGADPWQYKGTEYFSGLNGSVLVHANGATASTAMLDQLIDDVSRRGVMVGSDNALLRMSHRMLSKLSSLDANKQVFNDRIETPGGFRLQSYRGVPIYQSSFGVANQAWPGSTVTATPAATGGSLPDGIYRYFVSAVLQTGETLPSTEVSGTVSAGSGNGKVTLAWTAPAVAGSVRLYKIYRVAAAGGGAGTEIHYTTIPGVAYQQDAFGFLSMADIDTFVDTGVRTAQTVDYANQTVTGANYIPEVTSQSWDELAADEEDIELLVKWAPGVDGGGTTLCKPTLKPMGTIPLGKISDRDWFLIVEYLTQSVLQQFQGRVTRVKFS